MNLEIEALALRLQEMEIVDRQNLTEIERRENLMVIERKENLTNLKAKNVK